MPRHQLPPLNRQERQAAAKASRSRHDGRPMLSVREAGEYLSVHRMTVYRLIKAGKLRAFMVGDVLRIRQSDLDAYVEDHIAS